MLQSARFDEDALLRAKKDRVLEYHQRRKSLNGSCVCVCVCVCVWTERVCERERECESERERERERARERKRQREKSSDCVRVRVCVPLIYIDSFEALVHARARMYVCIH